MSVIGLWVWRLGVTAVLFFIGRLYHHGRQRLPEPPNRLASTAFFAGLALLWLVLASPLYQWADQLFFMRVIQDLLLAAWIPGLLLASNPFPALWQGVSAETQNRLIQFVQIYPKLEMFFRSINAGVAWLAFVSCFWFWYDGPIHQATLTYGWIRPFQIFSMLFVALLCWWHITEAIPYFHTPMPRLIRIFYAIVAAWGIKGVGLIFLFSPQSPYHYPLSTSIGLGLDDYSLGTVIMWLMGGIAYSTTATWLMRGWLGEEENKPTLPVSAWSSDEAFIAPGFGPE